MLSKTYVMGLKKLPDHFKVKSLLLVTLSKENIVLRMVILRRYQRCTLFRFCLFYLSFFYIQAWSFLYTGIKENTSVLRGKNPICDCFRCNHMPKGSRKKYYTLYSINVKARVKTHYLICFRHYLTRSRANIKSNFLFPSKKKLFPSFARSMFWVTMSNISTMKKSLFLSGSCGKYPKYRGGKRKPPRKSIPIKVNPNLTFLGGGGQVDQASLKSLITPLSLKHLHH